jgi:uncharacterized membrane protein
MTSNAVTYPSPTTPTPSRKKKWLSEMMNDEELAQHRREQAAERQRRKRERDRLGITVEQQQQQRMMMPSSSSADANFHNVHEDEQQQRDTPQPPGQSFLSQPSPTSSVSQRSTMSNQRNEALMTPEEISRRDRGKIKFNIYI